jgi:hypothetical protein
MGFPLFKKRVGVQMRDLSDTNSPKRGWLESDCKKHDVSTPLAVDLELSDCALSFGKIALVAECDKHRGHLSPSYETVPPLGTRSLELCCPLVNRISVAHAAVAAGANRNKVVKSRLAALALGDVVSALVVEHGDAVTTPRDFALSLKAMPERSDPDLLC